MAKARNLVKQLFLLLLIPVLAAVYFAGPSTASAAPRTTHFATTATHHPKKPCGIKHYPRCPHPKNKCHHKHLKPGHKVHVHSKHYPKHATVRVYIKGHGHHKLLARVKMSKHGSKIYSVKVPKNFKPGKYTLVFKSHGQKTTRVTITVKKTKKHHHHGHH